MPPGPIIPHSCGGQTSWWTCHDPNPWGYRLCAVPCPWVWLGLVTCFSPAHQSYGNMGLSLLWLSDTDYDFYLASWLSLDGSDEQAAMWERPMWQELRVASGLQPEERRPQSNSPQSSESFPSWAFPWEQLSEGKRTLVLRPMEPQGCSLSHALLK